LRGVFGNAEKNFCVQKSYFQRLTVFPEKFKNKRCSKVCNSGMKCYFCTRISKQVHLIYWKGGFEKSYQYFKKRFARKEIRFYLCSPRKQHRSFNLLRISTEKIKLKIIFKNACRRKKNAYFCTRFETQAKKKRMTRS
jgi:hypothetical protein